MPVVHLGRLAVDKAAQGQGLGDALVVNALSRVREVAGHIGIYAVEVWALTDRVATFYERHGFKPLLDHPLHLYLPMKVIRKLPNL